MILNYESLTEGTENTEESATLSSESSGPSVRDMLLRWLVMR